MSDQSYWSDNLQRRAATVELLVLDVDGVLTDGRLIYDAHGGESKAFHVRDGFGIKQLQAAGIRVAVISGRRSAAVETRLAELGVTIAALGRDDKLAALLEITAGLGIDDLNHIACVGDDVPDLQIISEVGLGIAVADAHPRVLAQAHGRTRLAGGKGAVREVCDLLLAARSDRRRA